MQLDSFLPDSVKAGDPVTAEMFTRILRVLGKQDHRGGSEGKISTLQMAYMYETAPAANKTVPSRFKVRHATYLEQENEDAIPDSEDLAEYAYNFYNTEVRVSANKVRLCWLLGNTLLLADCAEFDATDLDYTE